MTMRLVNPLLFLLLALAIAMMLLLSVRRWPEGMPMPQVPTLPKLSTHALKHPDAQLAWQWVKSHGTFCKWRCPDGRERFVCAMPNHRWAIVILDANRLVTAFTADQAYARDAVDGCFNPWHYSHP